MSAKKSLTTMTMENINKEQEALDKERLKLKERGRELKAEIDRRNRRETIVSKLVVGAAMSPPQMEFLQKLSKKERDQLIKESDKKRQDKAKAVLESVQTLDVSNQGQ